MTTTHDRLAPLLRKDSERLGRQLAKGVRDTERFERDLVAAEERLALRYASVPRLRYPVLVACPSALRLTLPPSRTGMPASPAPRPMAERNRRSASVRVRNCRATACREGGEAVAGERL